MLNETHLTFLFVCVFLLFFSPRLYDSMYFLCSSRMAQQSAPRFPAAVPPVAGVLPRRQPLLSTPTTPPFPVIRGPAPAARAPFARIPFDPSVPPPVGTAHLQVYLFTLHCITNRFINQMHSHGPGSLVGFGANLVMTMFAHLNPVHQWKGTRIGPQDDN